MHIEKNVCDNVVGTTLPIDGQSKDTMKTRTGMQAMGIRFNLWRMLIHGKYKKKNAKYTFKPDGKKEFFKWQQSVKFLDGYASNISKHVKMDTETLLGLKSHDYHVLLLWLFPIVIRPTGTSRLLRQ